MYKQSLGKKNQMQFANEHEFYKLLGYLAKSDGSTSLAWEHNENQGAWGSEGRIQVHLERNPGGVGIHVKTAGNGGNVLKRINCNDFVKCISTHHGFVMGGKQDVNVIINTVPTVYRQDFWDGFNL